MGDAQCLRVLGSRSDAQGQVGESSVAVEVLADARVGDDVIGAGHT